MTNENEEYNLQQNNDLSLQKKQFLDQDFIDLAEENRREFTANVTHELKTPLQSIMGSAELIENGLVKNEDLQRFAGSIRKEATRLLALIDDIIHLSRLDENKPLEFIDVDLYRVCEEEISNQKFIANNLNVQLYLEGEHIVINGVEQLISEIVHNLIDNAVKYNKENGRVTVKISKTDEGAVLCVSDTGIGIPDEYKERVFERFYRVDKSHSKATGGTGLGLSIVKHAAAYMNAQIKLESVVGEGTTITIVF